MPDEYDSPWKDGFDRFLSYCFALLFPAAYGLIEWSRGYEALDTELRKLLRKSKVGKRFVDRLYRVWTKDGKEAWILLHIEIQAQRDIKFSRRLFLYRCILTVHFDRPIATFAVLADDNPKWRPKGFRESVLGSKIALTFQSVKLLDFKDRVEELETSPNPFAKLVLAHLKTQETKGDPQTRFQWKLRVVRNLYNQGYSEEWIRELFRLIDWMMAIPEELDVKVVEDLERIEKEKAMPYITGIERRGEARGEARGKLQGSLRTTLELRFGITDKDDALINQIKDPETLETLLTQANQAKTIAEVRKALRQAASAKQVS